LASLYDQMRRRRVNNIEAYDNNGDPTWKASVSIGGFYKSVLRKDTMTILAQFTNPMGEDAIAIDPTLYILEPVAQSPCDIITMLPSSDNTGFYTAEWTVPEDALYDSNWGVRVTATVDGQLVSATVSFAVTEDMGESDLTAEEIRRILCDAPTGAVGTGKCRFVIDIQTDSISDSTYNHEVILVGIQLQNSTQVVYGQCDTTGRLVAHLDPGYYSFTARMCDFQRGVMIDTEQSGTQFDVRAYHGSSNNIDNSPYISNTFMARKIVPDTLVATFDGAAEWFPNESTSREDDLFSYGYTANQTEGYGFYQGGYGEVDNPYITTQEDYAAFAGTITPSNIVGSGAIAVTIIVSSDDNTPVGNLLIQAKHATTGDSLFGRTDDKGILIMKLISADYYFVLYASGGSVIERKAVPVSPTSVNFDDLQEWY